MSLDLGKAVLQLDRGALDLQRTRTARQDRLTALIEQARLVDPPTARGKTAAAASRPYLAAQVEEDLLGSVPPPHPPDNWRAISVDGSHIDVDPHLPIRCYLVNLGGCVLTYGSHPDAVFFNEPHLATDRAELYLTDEANPIDEEAITGPLLGIIRSIQELERLSEMLEDAPTDLPTLALLDGALTLWGLAGRVYPRFVRNTLLHQRFLPALERLRRLDREYPEGQHIFFYYLNTGQEIARVEVPQWAAQDPELLSLGHGLMVQQCCKGQGYPVVISEAHEQAVINGLDRRLFQQMVIETLERRGMATYTSEKERSKSRPWL